MSSSIDSKPYITKMKGGGKALETWKTKVVNVDGDLEGSPTIVMSMLQHVACVIY